MRKHRTIQSDSTRAIRKRQGAAPQQKAVAVGIRRSRRSAATSAVCGVQSSRPAPVRDKPHTAHRQKREGAEQTAPARDATPAVRVATLVENIDSETFQVELEFTDVDGLRKRWCFPRSALQTPSNLQKLLVDKGAVIPQSARHVLGSLQDIVPDSRRKVTGRAGWHGQDSFVLPRATLGNDKLLSFNGPSGDGESFRGLTKGTLKDWQTGLHEPLASSSYLTFVTALSFAAPIGALLDLEETAVFHTFGPSNTGKTLVQKVAASVLGRAKELDLISFNQTRAGSHDVMALWNGTLLTLNEMKTAEATNELKSYLVDLAHVLTSGAGRNRSNFSKRDPDLALKTWKAFGITNKEHSLESMASGKRDMGERARYIDVPVPLVSRGGIFDRVGCANDILPEKTRDLAELVARTIDNNYGVAFPRFVAFVIKRRVTVLRRFEKNVNRFVETYAPDDNWERRFARKFGYACAGGLAAVDAGVMPCSGRDVITSSRKLYRAARACFTGDADLKAAAIDKLLGCISDDRIFPRVEKDERVPDGFAKESWGFRRAYPKLGDCLAVKSEHLRQQAGTEEAFHGVMADLKRAGAHVPGRDKGRLTQIRELKGGGRRRYVLLRLPVLRRMLRARRTT